jgi:HD superfamily phosphohydrolase
MSNSFNVLAESASDDGTGSNSSREFCGDGQQSVGGYGHSPLRLRLRTAKIQLAQRFVEPVIAALELLESLLADCTPHDSGIVIQCHAHRGTAHMLLALFTCSKELYAKTLMHYEQAITEMTTAMLLCHTTSTADTSSEADKERLEKDRRRAADAISIDLGYSTQLRDRLVAAESRKQLMLDRSYDERDRVRADMGEVQWKQQRGNSQYVDKRRQMNKQLRELRAVLSKIDETEQDREALQTFEAQQQIMMPQTRENDKKPKEQQAQTRPLQRTKRRVWRKKQYGQL